jgi:aspartate aminotransferase-like enzyme
VPERVLRAGARPMLHHRTPEFSRELASLLDLIAPVFGTRQPVLPVHATGRGAMEATLCNLLSPGDGIIVCCNGRFGEMWVKLARSYGLVVHGVAKDWNRDVDLQEIEAALDAHPGVRAIAMSHSDTSTGVANDVAAIAGLARRRGLLSFVDGVSSIGGMPFAFDEWGVDAAFTASQKCLMSSPGLSFVALSERAVAASASATLPHNYWNFADIRREVTGPKPGTPGTPPVHCVLQVAEALRMIFEEGFDAVCDRHKTMAGIVQREACALGLSQQCPGLRNRSTTVTALALPAHLPPDRIRDGLKRRGILTAAALEQYQPAAFRIGHMGDIRVDDVEKTMAAVREIMLDDRGATQAPQLGEQ